MSRNTGARARDGDAEPVHRFDFFGDFGEALIALFYVGGSLMFFTESTGRAGVWLFLIGSLIWLSRPLIAMVRAERAR